MTAPRVHILGSYHYLKRVDLAAAFARLGTDVDFLADSGAFSAFTSGAVVRLEDYADWLLRHAAVIDAAATLDVIGDPAATAANTARLSERTAGRVPILPVFHVGSPWAELRRLCAEHPYVALGGAVGVNGRVPQMTAWLVAAHRIAADHDTRLHGFGLTRPPYPELLPFYSVDSIYWRSASRTGSLSLWDGRRFVGLRVGTPAVGRHGLLVRRYGGNPARIGRAGFGINSKSGVPDGAAARLWMQTASVRSLWRYQEHIHRRLEPFPAPRGGCTSGDGLKIYLAACAAGELTEIAHAVHTETAVGLDPQAIGPQEVPA
jgi:hypothetical protein